MKKKGISTVLILIVTLLLCVPALAADQEMDYVWDAADILSYEEWENLNQQAAEISENHSCGTYIVVLDDFESYGSGSVYDVTTRIYHDEEFGMGDGRDGMMLLLSMNDRDWAMFVYGDQAEYAFNDYGQKTLEKVFLDHFGKDDWYGGFSAYLTACDDYLSKADAGKPVRKSPMFHIVLSVVLSALLALIVCTSLKGKMKTVHKKSEAGTYAAGDVNLTNRYDQYTHTTQTRRETGKSSDSKKESGGGGSGRSGKF